MPTGNLKGTAPASVSVRAALTLKGNYAKWWYQDAYEEAAKDDFHARQKEVVLAVCFAESYLLEWTRDKLFRNDSTGFSNFIERWWSNRPPHSLDKRWKEVAKCTGSASGPFYVERAFPCWNSFLALLDYRHWCVHARASFPYKHPTEHATDRTRELSRRDLEKERGPGWAVRLVVQMIRDLHRVAGTTPPKWLKDPS